MSTVPFTPGQFTTPIISPAATTLTRRVPYIAPSEYKAAPTAVAAGSLVPGGTTAANASELYNVLLRASNWVDLICFHGADGTLAASPSIQSKWVRWKPSNSQGPGGYRLQCNFAPIIAVTGVALGCNPQQLTNITTAAAQAISIESWTIRLPVCAPLFGPSRQYAVWQYINGFPHMTLASNASQGATAITVAASVPTQGEPYGVYPGTQLTIRDPAGGVETVVVESISGTTLNLTSPLQFAHTVPAYPDFVYVTAIPHGVEQATISLASCLIKVRGTKAMVMPTTPGGPVNKTALVQAGGLEDYDIAVKLLKPFTSVYRAS